MEGVFVVMVKVDNGGSALVVCQELRQDPLFPDQVMLMNVQALSWPIQGSWLKVTQWSVKKTSVLNWMAGPLRAEFDLTMDVLEGKQVDLPWPPGTKPSEMLVNHPEQLKEAQTQETED